MEKISDHKTSRRWITGFLAIVLLSVVCYMAVCFRMNPEGYFTNVQGQPYYFKDDYARAVKARYLLTHKDEIEGIVIGGSKCGAVDTDQMTEYTGLRYYNMYLNLGNFKDYLAFTKFLSQKVQVKEILLILSNYEVLAYDREYRGNNYHTPALFSGKWTDLAAEFLSWMIVDPKALMDSVTRSKKNPAFADALVDGRRSRMSDIRSYNRDPDAFAQRILNDYEERLGLLFSGQIEDYTGVMKQNLEALRQMKEICEENGVNLRVVIGPSTMTERYRYETEDFYAYCKEIVQIMGEVWDFSDYNDINMNLYNYTDYLHYDVEVADLMVDTIYGRRSYEGFGQVLTMANVDTYLDQKRADFTELKTEYEQTGTVALKGRDDPGYLPWRTEWVSSTAAADQMRQYWDVAEGIEAADDSMDEAS